MLTDPVAYTDDERLHRGLTLLQIGPDWFRPRTMRTLPVRYTLRR